MGNWLTEVLMKVPVDHPIYLYGFPEMTILHRFYILKSRKIPYIFNHSIFHQGFNIVFHCIIIVK